MMRNLHVFYSDGMGGANSTKRRKTREERGGAISFLSGNSGGIPKHRVRVCLK